MAFRAATILCFAVAISAQCVGPDVNQATLDLTEQSEGFEASPYTDPSGNPTIGYGHECADSSCSDVPYPIPLSQADGQALLQSDMAVAQNCITDETADPVTLNANEYGALCDWAFNVGCGNVASSTLIQRLNDGEDPLTVIDQELPQWVYAGGQEEPGLVTRRQNEVNLANTATDVGALPAPCGS